MNAFSTTSLVLLASVGLLACSAGGGATGSGDGDGDTNTGDGDGNTIGDGDGDGDDAGGGTGSTGSSGGSGSGGGDPTGTGGDGSGGGGTPTGTLFFSDFEGDVPGNVMSGGVTWTTTLPTEYDSGGVVSIVSDKAYKGSQSVYVKKGSNGQAWLQLADPAVFPFAGDKIHVRAYINVPTWPTGGHTSWMEVGMIENDMTEIRVGANQGALEVNHWPGDEETVAPGVTMTANTWHCLEYAYDQAANSVEIWLDDTKIDALNVVNGVFGNAPESNASAPPIQAIRFGAEIAATEAWFDDIAVSASPIGCQ